MFDFLFKKQKINKSEIFNNLYTKIKDFYAKEEINSERKKELSSLIEEYGYLPYSQAKAINELTPAEVIFCLEKKLELNGTLKNQKLFIENNETSAIARHGCKNAEWIKKEQHDIKLINLMALGDGAKDSSPAKFIDWLRQIVILPSGNEKNKILSTTIYLVPFTPRDFGNAYLIAGTEEISRSLEDKDLKNIEISGKEQIKLFIALAQLAGHGVIYDIVPKNGRFSKTILAHPEIVRWIDVNYTIDEISKSLNEAAAKLSSEYDEDDVTIVKNIYKTTLKGDSSDFSSDFMPIYNRLTKELEAKRKEISGYITSKEQQIKLQKRVKDIIAGIEGVKTDKIKHDKDITKRGEIINALINEGLWTVPDGAWCSSGIPVFEKMSEGGAYPVFRSYNSKGEDVSEYSESDCETPFYFVYLENGEYNMPVIDFYLSYIQNLQEEYNFDGFRLANTDFVVDEMSEQNMRPISYRVPRFLITKINETMKKKVPYFASIAEYRLWNSYFKEYHKDMMFDVLWGNDAKTDYEKTPVEVIENNRELQEYNINVYNSPMLSILKTYNNQDGEFRTVNRFIGLTDKEEALFKWFKFKFLPSGKFAQRPCLYCDGDESFSKDGIEVTIQDEVSLIRSNDEDFYNKFDAIRRFAINNELTASGEAQIIHSHKDGYVSWMISKETVKERIIIAANCFSANEKILSVSPNGVPEYKIKKNTAVKNKKIEIPGDYELASEYVYENNKKAFVEHYSKPDVKTIKIDKLEPCEFRIFKIKRQI